MVASGVRPWDDINCCASARGDLVVARRLPGLMEDAVWGVKVGHALNVV